jgi:hypothetical protein
MNISGGISNTASLENIQLMAASRVVTTSNRSDFLESDIKKTAPEMRKRSTL